MTQEGVQAPELLHVSTMRPQLASTSTRRRPAHVFVSLVGLSALASVVAFAVADPPSDAPDFALNSTIVHRVEIGLAVFIAGYLVATALHLAMQGRAFTKLRAGAITLEAEQMAAAVESGIEGLDAVHEAMNELANATDGVIETLGDFDRRMDALVARVGSTSTFAELREDVQGRVTRLHTRMDQYKHDLDVVKNELALSRGRGDERSTPGTGSQ